MVSSLHYVESLLDPQAPATGDTAVSRVVAFRCTDCHCMFASAKALASHARSKHGVRSPWRQYVRSSVCPCCGTDYTSRLRCLAHVGDRRRPKCYEWIRLHVKPMPCDQLAQLDEFDRLERLAAHSQGHSQPLAVLPARRKSGRVYGHVGGQILPPRPSPFLPRRPALVLYRFVLEAGAAVMRPRELRDCNAHE